MVSHCVISHARPHSHALSGRYVLQCRMALAEPGRFASIPDFFRQTWRQDGWRAFFSGYTASALRVVPYRGIDMLTFMTLKELCVPQGAQVSLALMRLVRARTISSHTSFFGATQISMSQSMLFGAMGAGLSCLATAPLLTVRTKLMVQVRGHIFNLEKGGLL